MEKFPSGVGLGLRMESPCANCKYLGTATSPLHQYSKAALLKPVCMIPDSIIDKDNNPEDLDIPLHCPVIGLIDRIEASFGRGSCVPPETYLPLSKQNLSH